MYWSSWGFSGVYGASRRNDGIYMDILLYDDDIYREIIILRITNYHVYTLTSRSTHREFPYCWLITKTNVESNNQIIPSSSGIYLCYFDRDNHMDIVCVIYHSNRENYAKMMRVFILFSIIIHYMWYIQHYSDNHTQIWNTHHSNLVY